MSEACELVMIVSLSGTGKSVLAKKILSQSKVKRKYLLNDASPTPSGFEKMSMTSAFKLQQCSLIIEDLSFPDKTTIDLCDKLVSYKIHHSRISPVVFVLQSLVGTQMAHFLQYMKKIVFMTGAAGSIKSLKCVFTFYGLDRETKAEHCKMFLQDTSLHSFFIFFPHQQLFRKGSMSDFSTIDYASLPMDTAVIPQPKSLAEEAEENNDDTSSDEESDTKTAKQKRKIERIKTKSALMLRGFDKKLMSQSLLELILQHMDLDAISSKHLTIRLRHPNTGRKFNLSLIDFCLSCNAPNEENLDPANLDLHLEFLKTLGKKIYIPRSLVSNEVFKIHLRPI